MTLQKWNGDDSCIVSGGLPEEGAVIYPDSVRQMCLGLAGAGSDLDLAALDVARIEHVANALHRCTHWDAPPSPWRLAEVASVQLSKLPPGSLIPAIFKADKALYLATTEPRDDGLLAAFALASALVLQRDLPWSEVFRWRLAAELLAPAWAIDERGVDHLAAHHLHAPAWLVRQRNLGSLDTVANK